jgi:hypothetical protein
MPARENRAIVSAAVSDDCGSFQVDSKMAGTGIVRLTTTGVQSNWLRVFEGGRTWL